MSAEDKQGSAPEDELTIDELARRTGMTVRNIRAYQSRRLLPPPVVRGRTGYYGPEHAERLAAIQEMQAEGFSLELIRKLLSRSAGPDLLRVARAVREPFGEPERSVITLEELTEIWPGRDAPQHLQRAIKLGLLSHLGEGRFEVQSPRLFNLGVELTEMGVELEAMLDALQKLLHHSRGIARSFTEVFFEEFWKPFERRGAPEEEWSEMLEKIERVRPMAMEAVLGAVPLALDQVVEKTFGREVERLQREGRGSSRGSSPAAAISGVLRKAPNPLSR